MTAALREALLFDVGPFASPVAFGQAFELAKAVAAVAALAAAAWLTTGRGRTALDAADSWLSRDAGRASRLRFGLFAGACAALAALKTAQYLSLQGTDDAAMLLCVAWNAGTDGLLPNPVYGLASHIQDHFEPLLAAYMPLARLSGSPLAVVVAHALAVFSGLLAFDRLLGAMRMPPLPRAGLTAMLATNRYFLDALSTWFYPAPLAIPVLFAALWAWEDGRPKAALLLAGLAMLVKEEGAVAVGGLALAAVAMGRRGGWPLLAASAACFAGVVWVMGLDPGPHTYAKWSMFGWGDGPAETLSHALRRPTDLLLRWGWPPDRLAPLARLVASTGGALLLFPPGLLALLAVDAPHRLALHDPAAANNFHLLYSHYSSFLLPILFWGSAHGLRTLWEARPGSRRAAAAVGALCVAAGLLTSPPFVLPTRVSAAGLSRAWSAVDAVRPEDTVWAAQSFAPALAFRPRLKVLTGFPHPALSAETAPPDAVLLDSGALWFLGDAGAAELAAYLARRSCPQTVSEPGLGVWRCPPQAAQATR